MSHDLDMVNGQARMFSVKVTPWHSLGVVLDTPPATAEDAMRECKLDDIIDKPRLHLPGTVAPDGTYIPGAPTDVYSLVRRSDGKIISGTNTVTKVYQVVQPLEVFSFFNPFLEAKEASFETAGVLRGGQIIWALAKLNRDPSVIVPGDDVEKFILLTNSYDGKTSIRCGFSPVRVVCQNTLSMAISNEASSLLKVKHSKGVHENLEKVREIMNLANQKFEATADQFRFLASRQVARKDLEKFVEIVFNPKAEVEDKPVTNLLDFARTVAAETTISAVSEKESRSEKFNRERADIIKHLFEKGKGNEKPGVSGTYWAAYNAVTEYLTHMRPRMDKSDRLESLTFGTKEGGSAAISTRALGAALAFASAA